MIKNSIPVIVDSVKIFGEIKMSRCLYFIVELNETTPKCILGIKGVDHPLRMMGVRGIISSPSHREQIFNSTKLIDDLFNAIEVNEEQSIEYGTIWLPISQLDYSYQQEVFVRGAVFRLPLEIFTLCYAYTCNKIDIEEFRENLSNIKLLDYYSPEETRAFSEWTHIQIQRSRLNYKKHHHLALPPKQQEMGL